MQVSGERGCGGFHNNTGMSETVEGRENAAGGSELQSPAPGDRERDRFLLIFSEFSSLLLFLPFISFCTHFSFVILLHILALSCCLYFSVLHPDLRLSLSVLLYPTYGYLTVSFSFCCVSSYPTAILLSLLSPILLGSFLSSHHLLSIRFLFV